MSRLMRCAGRSGRASEFTCGAHRSEDGRCRCHDRSGQQISETNMTIKTTTISTVPDVFSPRVEAFALLYQTEGGLR